MSHSDSVKMAANGPSLLESSKTKKNLMIKGQGKGGGGFKLLRRPRASKLPPLEPELPPSPDKPFYEIYDFEQEEDFNQRHLHSPTPSVVPSLVSPPPSESHPTRGTYYRNFGISPHSNGSLLRKDDKKFVLDPIYREKTSLGTYVDGKSLVKPFKPRGPEVFPTRPPKKPGEILQMDNFEDIRYYQPPAFTLDNFVYHLSDLRNMPVCKVKEIFYSRHNYKKLTKLLAEKHINPTVQGEININEMTPEGQNIPPSEPRIPQKQLLIEMAAMIKQHVRDLMNTEVKSVIRPLRKYSPSYADDNVPHTEIILFEDDTFDVARSSAQDLQDTEIPGVDSMFHSAPSRYFQGAGRSQSPFTAPSENAISPSELAILDALINGGKALSLKAHFISEMPDISPLIRTVTYVNLSFNDFSIFPREILDIRHLEILKLRNNPLRELPTDIHRLRNLRILVVSFCLLTNIPMGLFALPKLIHLDISYNKLTFIQNEIANMRNLRELNMEGNQLPAMPCGALLLDLFYLNVKNNFMHPLFWKEHTQNQPQRLIDMCALTLVEGEVITEKDTLPESVRKVLANRSVCDCCHGALYGPGLRIIRPVSKLHGIKNLPFLFRACSPSCLQVFKHSKDTLSEILYGAQATPRGMEEEEEEEEE